MAPSVKPSRPDIRVLPPPRTRVCRGRTLSLRPRPDLGNLHPPHGGGSRCCRRLDHPASHGSLPRFSTSSLPRYYTTLDSAIAYAIAGQDSKAQALAEAIARDKSSLARPSRPCAAAILASKIVRLNASRTGLHLLAKVLFSCLHYSFFDLHDFPLDLRFR
jgi:hypothetical protein